MANPLLFKPKPHDVHVERERELAAAPSDHAEALLVAYQMLQTAHDKGILDLLHGLIGGRDIITSEIASGMNSPQAIAAIRNMIAMAGILASLNPSTLDHISKALAGAEKNREAESKKPPSLWSLMKRAFSADSRRGLSWTLTVLGGLGRSSDHSR